MTYNFEQIDPSPLVIEWLKYLASTEETAIDKLAITSQDLVRRGLNPYEVDYRLVSHGRLTLVGHWHIDKDAEIFRVIDRLIKIIRDQAIESQSKIPIEEIANQLNFTAEEVAQLNQIYLREIEMHLEPDGEASELEYFAAPSGHVLIKYIQYSNVFSLMEECFQSRFINLNRFNENSIEPQLTGIKSHTVNQVHETEPGTAFIMMSMNPEDPFLEDVHQTYKEVCAKYGLIAKRVDDLQHADKITDVILHQISTSELLIGDLTDARPNVYYEIGYAHAKGKSVHLFRRSGTNLHFDLSIHNAPEYRNISELRSSLTGRLSEALGRNPLNDA